MSADNRLLHGLYRDMRRIRSLGERVRELFLRSQGAGATGQSSTSTGKHPVWYYSGRGHYNGRYRDRHRQPRALRQPCWKERRSRTWALPGPRRYALGPPSRGPRSAGQRSARRVRESAPPTTNHTPVAYEADDLDPRTTRAGV